MNKFYFLSSVIFLLLLGAVSANNFSVSINVSSLPQRVVFNGTIDLSVNESVFFSRLDNNSFVNLSYPSSILFTSSVMPYELVVNVSDELSEDTNITVILLLNNSFNNVTANIYVNIKVFSDVNSSVFEDEIYDVRVLNGDFHISLTTNVLSVNSSVLFNVSGRPGDVINITCFDQSIISCPINGLVNSDGLALIKINYFVPFNMSLGDFSYLIGFVSGNVTRNSTIYFHISYPDINMLSYVFEDDCFVEVDGENYTTVKYDCILAQEEYNIKRLANVLERVRAIRGDDLVCDPVIETEYLVAGEIDKDIYSEWSTCRVDRNVCVDSLNSVSTKFSACESERASLKDLLAKNDSVALLAAHDYRQKVYDDLEFDKKKVSKIIWSFIIWFIVILLVVFFVYRFFKKKKEFVGMVI